jgi:hypothetical protein
MQGTSWQRPSSPHTVDVYDLREVRCTTALIPVARGGLPFTPLGNEASPESPESARVARRARSVHS